jgi:hypothetical protein
LVRLSDRAVPDSGSDLLFIYRNSRTILNRKVCCGFGEICN